MRKNEAKKRIEERICFSTAAKERIGDLRIECVDQARPALMKLFRNHCARNVGGECIVVYNDRVAHQACVVMSFVDYLALKAKATAPIKKEATNV